MSSSLCPVLAVRRPGKSKHRFRYVNLLQVRKRLLFIDLFIYWAVCDPWGNCALSQFDS